MANKIKKRGNLQVVTWKYFNSVTVPTFTNLILHFFYVVPADPLVFYD